MSKYSFNHLFKILSDISHFILLCSPNVRWRENESKDKENLHRDVTKVKKTNMQGTETINEQKKLQH